jgi:23S rRNA pseudouridine1911/1915/1917 synthase
LGGGAAGFQVIDYLTRCYSAFTREEWLARIHSGRVLLDGVPVQADRLLQPGRTLSWVRPPWREPEVPRSFAILYQDEYLLGVAKPSGLPTLPGGGEFLENTLLSLVRRHYPEASPMHRLGRGTSGVVLFALNRSARTEIARAWRDGEVLKIYRALVSGSPAQDRFAVDIPIGLVPHPLLKNIHGASASGKPARSEVTVLERRASSSLLEVRIATGRAHQIRIHLAAAGYPLTGEPLYASGGIPGPESTSLPSDLGYYLHSALLGFHHPADGKWIEINCVPPPILRCGWSAG